MARETWVQSQVESYQRLKKWYLMPPCLTLSIIRYGSRVKWSNPGKGVAPFPTPWCSSYRKGSLRVTLDYGRQLYLLTLQSEGLRKIVWSISCSSCCSTLPQCRQCCTKGEKNGHPYLYRSRQNEAACCLDYFKICSSKFAPRVYSLDLSNERI